ncbi:3b8b3426-6313-4c2a-b5bb-da3e86342417 [Thermothielavioides terrestris]|uniref:3b8b3426-6313-4c2a-b5bb-da3e86342417 n=1 Tax=Thermothielavioides terrestris TaxID=2587410 RepID=A0A3S4BAP6_9PEZI|nr:3b8b3426-6313-4c2a-b5bb-da3e86342417 [Thermothielavioides terrestris]
MATSWAPTSTSSPLTSSAAAPACSLSSPSGGRNPAEHASTSLQSGGGLSNVFDQSSY